MTQPESTVELEYEPVHRLRGLRMPALPTGSWLGQVFGGAATLTGVWLQFGFAIALIVGGAAGVVLGALKESGRI